MITLAHNNGNTSTCICREEQLQALHCHLCGYILRNPHTVSCCKENFCKSCIKHVKEQHDKCPKCGILPQEFVHYPNKKLGDAVLQFEVYCMNRCGWKGALNEHNTHLNINPSEETWLEGCNLIRVKCIHCEAETHERSRLLHCLMNKIETKMLYTFTTSTCPKICTKWKNIGLELGLDRSTIEACQLQNKTEEDCYCDMLNEWCQSSMDATYRTFLKTLRSNELRLESLARQIEKGKTFYCIFALLSAYHRTGFRINDHVYIN